MAAERAECSVDGCDQKRWAREWCGKHYKWALKIGLFVPKKILGRNLTCHCGLRARARGMCNRHYQNWKYQQDPEYFKNRTHADWHRDPEKSRVRNNTHAQRRRARHIAADGRHTTQEWLGKLAEYDGKCAYCGDEATTRDHVVPLVNGGSNWISNIVPACRPCNYSKRTRSAAEFLNEKAA